MKVAEAIEEFEKNFTWVEEHYAQLRSQYPGSYIAVLDGQVVDSDPDVKALSRRLRETHGERERGITVRYISKKDFEMILTAFFGAGVAGRA